MINLVIFDLDDTLYNRKSCNKIAENYVLDKISDTFAINRYEVENLFKKAQIDIKQGLGNVAASHNRLLYMQRLCELCDKNALVYASKFNQIYWNSFFDNMCLFDYVLPLMDYLKDNDIKIGILTDLTAEVQYKKIKKLEIENYIDYIVTSEEVGEEKPSAIMFKKMLLKSNCSPSETLMIGDNYKRDIIGAQNYGINTLLFSVEFDMLEEVKKII